MGKESKTTGHDNISNTLKCKPCAWIGMSALFNLNSLDLRFFTGHESSCVSVCLPPCAVTWAATEADSGITAGALRRIVTETVRSAE